MESNILGRLLASPHIAVRYRGLTELLDTDPTAPAAVELREQIPASPLVARLLSERLPDGTLPYHPYSKWRGAHWILATLADLGYPPGDESLVPLREQVLAWLLGKKHQQGIRAIEGRVRRCASQEGNALYALLRLGLADGRADVLARELQAWQWPDGGWNCDKRPEAHVSSFHETLLPLRGLIWHARLTGSRASHEAAERAAEVFLKRELFRRLSDGSVIAPDFLLLRYPYYWYYNVLAALKVMAEGDRLRDERCRAALDLLTRKQRPDGGFPAETKYYRVTDNPMSQTTLVDWGGASKTRMNEFVTLDALVVLKQAGRLQSLLRDREKQ